MNCVKKSVYPAMVTTYKQDGGIDFDVCRALVDWYARHGCDGIFADCMSNEIFFLSLEERIRIAQTVTDAAKDYNLDIVISGHVSDGFEGQITELKAMAALKPKAVVLITNRLAKENESDRVLIDNAKAILREIPDMDFGLYEAPGPYKRELSPETLKELALTDRFVFMKDTCCENAKIKAKLEAVNGSRVKIYNANSATLLESLYDGCAGYCGVMANFHPELLVELMRCYENDRKKAAEIQNYLGFSSAIEYQMYPLNAKYFLSKRGLPVKSVFCRNRSNDILKETMIKELDQMFEFEKSQFSEVYLND